MGNSIRFGSASHLASRGSWKAGSPTSNLLLKAESRQFFIPSVAFVTWKHGADIERYHNKSPWRPQTKKSIRKFIVKGMSCLDLARAANFGNRIFTAKNNSNPASPRAIFKWKNLKGQMNPLLEWMLNESWRRLSLLSSTCQHVATLQFDSCAEEASLCGRVVMAWI